MTQHNMDRPRIPGLSLRRVTRYMALLAKDWDEQGPPEFAPREQERPGRQSDAPAIPDPWDVGADRSASVAPVFSIPRTLPSEDDAQLPQAGTAQAASQPSPWQEDPVTVAHGRAFSSQSPASQTAEFDEEVEFWATDLDEGEGTALPWDIPEEVIEPQEDAASGFKPVFASAKEQDDFTRAMMYLSADDDFLVTGVGKREPVVTPRQAEEIAQAPAPSFPLQGEAPSEGPEPMPIPLQRVAPPQRRDASPDRPKAVSGGGVPFVRILLIVLIALVLLGAGLAVWYFVFSDEAPGVTDAVNASAIYLGDENLGCVEDGMAVRQVLDNARERVAQKLSLPVVLEKELRIEPMVVDARFLAPLPDMQQAVLDRANVLVMATGVYVDGRLVATAASEQEIDHVLTAALEPFEALAGGRAVSQAGFAEQIEYKPITALPEELLDEEALRRVLITGEQNAPSYYEVQQGDSLIAIANEHDLTLGSLCYANPSFIGRDLIRVGDRLCVTPPKGILTVRFTERVTEEIPMPYETVTKSSDSMYTTQTEVEQKGEAGLREVVADKVYIAGVLAHQDILEETVLKEPVDRILIKGTKKPTNAGGSGTYVWPAEGRISSRFGARWGKQHKGLDIAASTGTPIYAARDGTVTFSGTSGTYGKLVKISHGSGIETRYAHCSTLKVSSGDTVKKGQIIALVGSTGNSTGPHLHFEVLVDGVQKNPENYLPKR